MLDDKLLIELRQYVENHLSPEVHFAFKASKCFDIHQMRSVRERESDVYDLSPRIELEDYIANNRKPTFSQVLFSFIDKKGAVETEIYKKAGIDRRHFSKIRSNPDYRIGKNTAVALALALELNKEETDKLLGAAGYSLSENDTFDLVIQFFLEKKIYDISFINEALDYFSLKTLAGSLE